MLLLGVMDCERTRILQTIGRGLSHPTVNPQKMSLLRVTVSFRPHLLLFRDRSRPSSLNSLPSLPSSL